MCVSAWYMYTHVLVCVCVCVCVCMYSCTVPVENTAFKAEEKIEMS